VGLSDSGWGAFRPGLGVARKRTLIHECQRGIYVGAKGDVESPSRIDCRTLSTVVWLMWLSSQ
jgi:hypothetical protein